MTTALKELSGTDVPLGLIVTAVMKGKESKAIKNKKSISLPLVFNFFLLKEPLRLLVLRM